MWRLLAVAGHLVRGLLTVFWVFPKLTEPARQRRVQQWSHQMLGKIAIDLRVTGAASIEGPALLVANHISWLDITALHAARYCRFVSKGDVRHWPLVGALASGIGTLFIERESRRDAMRVVHHMAQSLKNGDVLGIFPEGTTSNGTGLLPFHANLFQSAIVANAPVQPMAVQYIDTRTKQRSLAPSYVDGDTLMGSLWRTLTADPITVVIVFGEPQFFAGRDRRTWAKDVQAEVERLRLP